MLQRKKHPRNSVNGQIASSFCTVFSVHGQFTIFGICCKLVDDNRHQVAGGVLQATLLGNTKLAQNILFFGATSRTSQMLTSPSLSPSPGLNSYPNCLEISSHIN